MNTKYQIYFGNMKTDVALYTQTCRNIC